MACTSTRPAWKSPKPNPSGKHPIYFSPPTNYRDPDYWIPCQKCEGCRAKVRQDWGIRIYHESQMWDQTSFITLTYDDEHLVDKINKPDLQKFFRKLKRNVAKPIRYYACGEYGEKTKRPHYHAIIFNEDFLSSHYYYGINDDTGMYGNAELDRIWGKGQVSIKTFTPEMGFYTAGYVAKKIDDSDTFSLQSCRPPIGRTWLRKYHDNLRRLETVQINGKSLPIPSAYLNWLEGVESFNHIKENMRQKVTVLNNLQSASKRDYYQAKAKLKAETI